MKRTIIATLVITLLPVVITSCFKLTEVSVGPIVFFYPILGGLLLGVIWGLAINKRIGAIPSVILAIVIGVLGYGLLINWFIMVTHFMGEMDYSLM